MGTGLIVSVCVGGGGGGIQALVAKLRRLTVFFIVYIFIKMNIICRPSGQVFLVLF